MIGPLGVSGVGQVPRSLTINGVTVQASFVYDGRDLAGAAGSLTWTERYGVAGGGLTESGGALTRGNAGPFTDGTTGVLGDATGYIVAANNTHGDVTVDGHIGVVFRGGTNGVISALLGKRLGSGAYEGWLVYQRDTNTIAALFNDSDGQYVLLSGGAITSGCVYVADLFWDWSDGASTGIRLYCNGVAVATGSLAASSVDATKCTCAAAMRVFSQALGGLSSTALLYYVDQHLQDGWFVGGSPNGTEWLAAHQERCSRIFGLIGHARAGVAYPAIARASNRYYQVGSVIYGVGNGGHAIEEDGAGDRFVRVHGEYTNTCPRSSSVVGWSTSQVTHGDSGLASPIAGINWQRTVEATSAGGAHLSYIAASAAPAQDQKFLLQAYVRAGDRYATLRAWTAGGDFGVNCDPATGAIVATGATGTVTLHVSGIIPLGPLATDGYLLWAVASDAHATPGAPNMAIHCADSESLSATSYDVYAGDATAYPLGVLWCGVVCAIGATGPLPYIHTAGAAASKLAEVAYLSPASFSIPGGVNLVARTRDLVPTNKRLWSWYDADAGSVIELYLDADAHVHLVVYDGASAEVDIEVAAAINNGELHRVRAGWETDNCALWVDGVAVRDTDCAMPAVADLDTCQLGGTAGACQFDGEIHLVDWHPRRTV